MKRILVFSLLLGAAAAATAAPALAVEKPGGLAASFVTPMGDFADVVDNGIGLGAIFDYPLAGGADISGSLFWYSYSGLTLIEGTNVKAERTALWEFAAGPQFDLGKFYVGAELGYYTNLDEWGVTPNIGLRQNMLDFSVRYKATGDGQWLAARLGFFF